MNDDGLLKPISFLHTDRYKATLEKARDGAIGLTHAAEIVWPDGVIRNSWVKIYKKEFPRGLVNEAIGYILAAHLKLPQPDHAGFLMYPTEWILDESDQKSLSEVDLYRGYTIAWVTSDTKGFNLRLKFETLKSTPDEYKKIFDFFKKDIQDWGQLPDLIAFDYATHNEDRNLGNLLQLPDRSFCLIDHGEILTSSNWEYWDLISPKNNGWKLMNEYIRIFEEIFLHQGIFCKLAAYNSLASCYEATPDKFDIAKKELTSYLQGMLNGEIFTLPSPLSPISVTDSIIDFLEFRSSDRQSFVDQCAKFLEIPTESTYPQGG